MGARRAPMAEPAPEPEVEPGDPIPEGDDELPEEDAEGNWSEVEDLKEQLAESQNELEAKTHELAKSDEKRLTLERLLDERSKDVEHLIEQRKRLGDDLASYLRAAGARRGRSSAEVQLLQSELRAARAKARALAEDAIELELRFRRKSAESNEHSNKRVWLEKRLSKSTMRVNALEDGLSQFQELHKAQVEAKQAKSATLGRTKLRLAETEMAGDLLGAKLIAAQEKYDVVARMMGKLHGEVEKGATRLSGLGPGQDKCVTDLRERLKVAHDAKMRAECVQEDMDVQTDEMHRAKAQEHVDELKRMAAEVKEGETAMVTEDAEAPDPADHLLRQAEERTAPVEEEEEPLETLRDELRAGIREVDMQRQMLGWAGVGLDEDANQLLAAGKREEDIAARAVGSLLMWASLTPIGTVGDQQIQTMADTGIVLAFSNARLGKEPLKHFSPHLKGLPRLYAELEDLTVHGYHTPEERKRRAKATATFQAMLRLKRALKVFRKRQREKLEHLSATTINSYCRGHLGRKAAAGKREEHKHEQRILKKHRDLAHAEAMMEHALGTDDEDDDGDVYEHANLKLKKANRSYRHMIRGLPCAAVAHLSANKKHGPLYAILMQAVMGSKDYHRRLKKYKKLRNNGNVARGWATLDDDDDSVSAQAVLRERIWQLEGDVSALLLVDARRRLADRRQTLIDSNKGKAIAPHQAYAQEKEKSRSLADIGVRPKPQPWLTSPEPTYRPQTTDSGFRPATSGSIVDPHPPMSPGARAELEYQQDAPGSLAGSPREDASLTGWSEQVSTQLPLAMICFAGVSLRGCFACDCRRIQTH